MSRTSNAVPCYTQLCAALHEQSIGFIWQVAWTLPPRAGNLPSLAYVRSAGALRRAVAYCGALREVPARCACSFRGLRLPVPSLRLPTCALPALCAEQSLTAARYGRYRHAALDRFVGSAPRHSPFACLRALFGASRQAANERGVVGRAGGRAVSEVAL